LEKQTLNNDDHIIIDFRSFFPC